MAGAVSAIRENALPNLEDLKSITERLTGFARPKSVMPRQRKPHAILFDGDCSRTGTERVEVMSGFRRPPLPSSGILNARCQFFVPATLCAWDMPADSECAIMYDVAPS